MGLVLVFDILMRISSLPFYLEVLAYNPSYVVMEAVYSFLGACLLVYVFKRVVNWFRRVSSYI